MAFIIRKKVFHFWRAKEEKNSEGLDWNNQICSPRIFVEMTDEIHISHPR